jgi:hypothetical protein
MNSKKSLNITEVNSIKSTTSSSTRYKFSIDIPILDAKIIIIFCKDFAKTFNRVCKKEKAELELEGGEDAVSIILEDPTKYYIIYNIDKLGYNVLTHEVHHITHYIAEYRNMLEDTESMAWLNGFINEKVINFVHKKNLELK